MCFEVGHSTQHLMHLLTLTVFSLVVNLNPFRNCRSSHRNHNNDLYGYDTIVIVYTFTITYYIFIYYNSSRSEIYIYVRFNPLNTLQTWWSLTWCIAESVIIIIIKQFWRKWLYKFFVYILLLTDINIRQYCKNSLLSRCYSCYIFIVQHS